MIATAYDLIAFDLDGTLVDSLDDLAASVNWTLRSLDLEELPIETVRDFVGNGARKLIERSLVARPPTASEVGVDEALARFLEHYEEHCTARTLPYPEVPETLAAIAAQGVPMAVLTNKPEAMSHRVLDALHLAGHFPHVVAGDTLATKKPDPEGLLWLAARHSVRPERVLLVGDTAVDAETAANAPCAFAGVTWGFRPGEVRAAAPDHLLERFSALTA